jgi:hypothetical protein
MTDLSIDNCLGANLQLPNQLVCTLFLSLKVAVGPLSNFHLSSRYLSIRQLSGNALPTEGSILRFEFSKLPHLAKKKTLLLSPSIGPKSMNSLVEGCSLPGGMYLTFALLLWRELLSRRSGVKLG